MNEPEWAEASIRLYYTSKEKERPDNCQTIGEYIFGTIIVDSSLSSKQRQ